MAPVDYAALGARVNGDIYNLNGGYLLVDTDTRYGLNGSTAGNFGNITGSASLGGVIEFNSTKVRLIPFTGGSGTVPAADVVISQGGASGKLHGVYAALNAAPLAAAAAMPATGWIKIRAWNSVSFTAAALTGIAATGAADGPGWLEIVGQDALTATINRLNKFVAKGDFYTFQGVTTTGVRTSGYQLPTNGSAAVYCPGVEVETGVATGVYESYPCAGTIAALAANIGTERLRGRWCWIAPATGVVTLGSDGTNSTGGYCPPAGCRIRVANIFMVTCASAAVVNNLPNATLSTRYEFLTTGGGVIDMDKVSCNWFCNFSQPYGVKLTNVSTLTNITLSECASPIAWSQVSVGQEAANSQQALSFSLNFAGGTMADCTWTRANQAASGNFITAISDSGKFTVTNERNHSLVKAANSNAGTATLTRVSNSTWTNTVIGGGQVSLTTCSAVKYLGSGTIYYDHPATTTGSAIPMTAYAVTSACKACVFDAPQSGGLAMCQPYTAVLAIKAAGCEGTVLRNPVAGEYELGGAQANATYIQATTTATATTPAAHGLKVNDIIYALISSNTSIISVGAKTVLSVPTANSFTFACTTGTTTGTFVYFPTVVGVLVAIAGGAAANDVKIQNVRGVRARSGLINYDNSSKNIVLENATAATHLTQVVTALNCKMKAVGITPTLAAQTAVYGSHFIDAYVTGTPTNTAAVAWTRSATVATVTSAAHGLRTGDSTSVTVSGDVTAIALGIKTITALTADTYSFTANNTGAVSGALTFLPANGRIGIQMNEPTSETASQVVLAGTATFTSAGTLYMPAVNDQADFTCPDNIEGHAGFPIAEVVMAGGTLTNYDILYSVNGGVTYKNLSYPRTGAAGSTAAFVFTLTSAAGVQTGDFAFGTNVAPHAKVTGVVGNTVTVDQANVGVVSGILRFNQMPNEVISDPAVTGFPLKVRIKTTTANVLAISSLQILTFSTAASRLANYPLDTITLTLTGLQTGSDVVILQAGTTNILTAVDANAGTQYSYVYEVAQNIDIGIIKPGFVPLYIRNYPLTTANASVPIAQTADRNFQ